MERLLNHRDVNSVRTSYLVRWRGYPPAWDIWYPRAQLIVNVLGIAEQCDETQLLHLKKGRRKTTSLNASLPRSTPVELVPRPDWVAFLKPDASCIKFIDPGLTANAHDVMDEGIPSLHQGFAVSHTAAIVPPMFEERIGEEFFLSTDSFRAEIRWKNLPAIEQRDLIPFGSRSG
uniref:Chromo domain-containing protein n=1 Tax=Peronospora matthiolae TaxID=2874970 RepID=A0AAV1TV11_9STRA